MTRISMLLGATALAAPLAAALPATAQDAGECGEVSIAQMNWAAANVTTEIARFLLVEGYNCDVTLVPSDTIPAVTSVSENGEPDVVTNLWLNSAGDAYRKLEDRGTMTRVNNVLQPGGVEGWWIPTYLAEEHPELTTIEGVMENPELVGARFNNCPDGWGCRVVSDNLVRALDLEGAGIEVFNHGSGETLASSMGSAVEDEEPWFGYYWGPTVPMGKYDMTRVDLGPVKDEAFANLQNPDTPDPQVSDFPAAPILTSVTTEFAESNPEVTEFFSNMSFQTDTMSALLAWQDENSASADETAAHFLQTYQDEWSGWLNESARENLSSLLGEG
ncbi:ABC transporter substrate-binding protein [Psychromarinibacter sp. C21-152]|uniref:ABC transporter substrate-binding protein n=1 Tax=Psychromarinibacter sediminicola TaxID=3033385 RepID=A0AAE3NQI8_9RHOB|nr:ABC transporter substrate-binding protein [Psychromarinibacter sediminicola]MDF0600604.1 ABC transporter substrate-binding protein [Psychromarinibacter sediminicola]